ncbi:hypothetical protein [Breoghania sp. L-A4]|uniref:hypothetical protein n=1 Tax=Breoghania sp. L-A4 TaxID=2304600 RepID=UPI000E35A7F1|nr:hypothetical protein [Breoghania sp. L-A4]AXS38874.1 hypothetical protein D1F64_00860 [Breoghania sp. L-A4]
MIALESYPVADAWFSGKPLDDTAHMLIEPHVHVLEQANMVFLRGRDRELMIDTGMGIVPIVPLTQAAQ